MCRVAEAVVAQDLDHAAVLERVQTLQALLHFLEPPTRYVIGALAARLRTVGKTQKPADGFDREAEIAGMANEGTLVAVASASLPMVMWRKTFCGLTAPACAPAQPVA